jgi:hypothetical protein
MRREIRGERIDLGEAALRDVNLIDCEIVFDGMGDVSMVGVDLVRCKFTFTGPAGTTLSLIRHMVEAGYPVVGILSEEIHS